MLLTVKPFHGSTSWLRLYRTDQIILDLLYLPISSLSIVAPMQEKTHQLAVVLKALEIRAQRQDQDLGTIQTEATEALTEARRERQEWEDLVTLVGGPSPRTTTPTSILPVTESVSLQPVGSPRWDQILQEAESILQEEGVDPAEIQLEVPGALDKVDVVASLAFGALSAVLPSLGSRGGLVKDAFQRIQEAADYHSLPDLIQSLFGDKPAAFMDAGAQGMYHRFIHGHDLFWAIPEGMNQLGFLTGVKEVFQHLLRDAFGRTGIPLPGSTLIGDAVAQILGKHGIADLIAPRDLSRYTGLQLADGVSTGTTSLLLWLYGKVRGIPSGSMRAARLAILAHGFCFVGVAMACAIPGLAMAFPYRSHLNYVSLAAMGKNTVQLWMLDRQLQNENARRFTELEHQLSELEQLRIENDLRQQIDQTLHVTAVTAARFGGGH